MWNKGKMAATAALGLAAGACALALIRQDAAPPPPASSARLVSAARLGSEWAVAQAWERCSGRHGAGAVEAKRSALCFLEWRAPSSPSSEQEDRRLLGQGSALVEKLGFVEEPDARRAALAAYREASPVDAPMGIALFELLARVWQVKALSEGDPAGSEEAAKLVESRWPRMSERLSQSVKEAEAIDADRSVFALARSEERARALRMKLAALEQLWHIRNARRLNEAAVGGVAGGQAAESWADLQEMAGSWAQGEMEREEARAPKGSD